MTLGNTPRLLKAALAVVDSGSGQIDRLIPFQFNPSKVSRAVAARDIDPGGDPQKLVRLAGPPTVVWSFEAILDASDALDEGDATATELGIAPRLDALEQLVTPPLSALLAADALADEGALELMPAPPALTLLVWSSNRVFAVRMTQIDIEEELHDRNLNTLRARVNISATVLTSDELGVATKGGGVYLAALEAQERRAGRFRSAASATPQLGAI